jgi:hypothetical protein
VEVERQNDNVFWVLLFLVETSTQKRLGSAANSKHLYLQGKEARTSSQGCKKGFGRTMCPSSGPTSVPSDFFLIFPWDSSEL